jgi:hypothetical protein
MFFLEVSLSLPGGLLEVKGAQKAPKMELKGSLGVPSGK